jgi:glycosyltransferase involved in cell wall biosynthesis
MRAVSDVCILLPVLNEIENIGPLIDRIRAFLNGRDYVICIVDDGSRDGTVRYIRDAMEVEGHRLHLIERKKTTRGSQRGSALYAAMTLTWKDAARLVILSRNLE